MLPHWLRHTYREVTWSGPQQGLIGIPYWEQHQFVIADLGTLRFLDVWSFSGETILVLSNNLDHQLSSHSPRVLVCLQWSSAVNWFAIVLSLVSLWRTFIETILLSGMSAKVVQRSGLLKGYCPRWCLCFGATPQLKSDPARRWCEMIIWRICICRVCVGVFVFAFVLFVKGAVPYLKSSAPV